MALKRRPSCNSKSLSSPANRPNLGVPSPRSGVCAEDVDSKEDRALPYSRPPPLPEGRRVRGDPEPGPTGDGRAGNGGMPSGARGRRVLRFFGKSTPEVMYLLEKDKMSMSHH
nr:uncharacterized protein LOC123568040 [Macaca fascicularis]